MSIMEQLVERLAQQGQGPASEDLERQRQAWLEDLGSLIQRLKAWLKPGVDQGVFALTDELETLAEEDLGEYEAPALRIRTLTSSPRTIRVRPRGLRIVGVITDEQKRVVGAQGRVDITSGPARVMLLRFVEKSELVSESEPASAQSSTIWKVVGDDQDSTVELGEESFARALEDMIA